MKVRNMVKVLEIIKEFCASIDHKECQGCPFCINGFGCGLNFCGGPQEWPLERIKEKWMDYEVKTTSCENLKYSHPSLYNGECTHDLPNHRHEYSAQDMIHHPGHYNFRHEDSAPDMIHHPGHYNFRGMECKDFIEKFVSDPKSYYEGNIFKYLYRYLEKNKEEDLNKAMEYTRLLKEYLYGKKD